MENIDIDATHKIVNALLDRNRLLLRIRFPVMQEFRSQIGQTFLKDLFGNPSHIQVNLWFTIRLVCDKIHFPGDYISGHQVAEFRIFLFHEIPGFSRSAHKEPSSLSSGSLTD